MTTSTPRLFTGYDTGNFFDEMFTPDGAAREHYRTLLDRLEGFTTDELQKRERRRDQLFHQQGITFTVYGEEAGVERTFPMDLVPRIIPADEWDVVEAGLGPARHGPQPVPGGSLRRRPCRDPRRHRAPLAHCVRRRLPT